MTTYQDVVAANQSVLAYSLTEAAGNFAPFIGAGALVAQAPITYRQAGPAGSDFAIQIGVGGKATYTFAVQPTPPFTTEVWVKMTNLAPAANLRIWSTGNDTANGVEFYMTPTAHLHLTGPGVFDIDTGIVWPDLNWHLLHLASSLASAIRTVALDGIVRYQANPGVATLPTPDVVTFGGSSGVNETQATSFAWPAFYLYAMSPANMASTFQAIASPAGALAGTVSGGAATPTATATLLQQILDSVRKIY